MDDNTHYEESVEVGDWLCFCWLPNFTMDLLWWLR